MLSLRVVTSVFNLEQDFGDDGSATRQPTPPRGVSSGLLPALDLGRGEPATRRNVVLDDQHRD
jgi:hypothetical protein